MLLGHVSPVLVKMGWPASVAPCCVPRAAVSLQRLGSKRARHTRGSEPRFWPGFLPSAARVKNSRGTQPTGKLPPVISTLSSFLPTVSIALRGRTHPQMALTAEIRTDGGCVS